MVLAGTIRNGTIVLDQPAPLLEGTRVEVVVKEATAAKQPRSLRDVLLQSAGCLSELPADFAEQHDHYIHGAPKR